MMCKLQLCIVEVINNSGQNIYTIDKSSQKRPNQHMKYSTVIEELMIKKVKKVPLPLDIV